MARKVITLQQLPDEIDKIYDTLMRQVKKTRIKTTRDAGMYMIDKAKAFAPNFTGETKRGITGNKSGKDYMVYSRVNQPFPHNVWADNRIVGTRRQIPYPWVQKTGITGGGFFTKAEEVTQKYFENIVVKDMSQWETVK